MNSKKLITAIASCIATAVVISSAAADDLRKVKHGEPLPEYRLPTIGGEHIDSESLEGKVIVIVYLSAEQRSSELAAAESQAALNEFDPEKTKLIHVTADVVHKPYFERFRDQKGITAPLAFDATRELYGDLGLIVFPTTIVVAPDGTLAHVISTRGPDYRHLLTAFVQHTLGMISDAELKDRLQARASDIHSPKSLASRHRAAARLLREKGLFEAAREELLAARELDTEDVDIRLDLADLDMAMGNLEEAENIVATILAQNPDHRRAKLLKGIILFESDQLSESEALLKEALVLNPDPARTHYYLGRIYEKQGNAEKAIEHYREALRRLLHEKE